MVIFNTFLKQSLKIIYGVYVNIDIVYLVV
jgi:hypothetical protein